MDRINKEHALNYIRNEENEFKFGVELNFITKFQLYLSGNILNWIDIFGIGLQEIRGLGFILNYHEVINTAIGKNYRVIVKKDGKYFEKGIWYLVPGRKASSPYEYRVNSIISSWN